MLRVAAMEGPEKRALHEWLRLISSMCDEKDGESSVIEDGLRVTLEDMAYETEDTAVLQALETVRLIYVARL